MARTAEQEKKKKMQPTKHTRESLTGEGPYFTDERLPVPTRTRAVHQYPKIVAVLMSREEMLDRGTMSVANEWEQDTFYSYAMTCEENNSFTPRPQFGNRHPVQRVLRLTFYGKKEEERSVVVSTWHGCTPHDYCRSVAKSIALKGWYLSVIFLEGGEVIMNGRVVMPIPQEVSIDVEVVVSGGERY